MVNGLVSAAYFASWSIYARNFNVWDINPTGLTHINYAFANIANGEVVLGDPWADTDKVNPGHGDSWNDPPGDLHGNFYQMFRLKSQYRWIKTGISVGGWTWSGKFSDVAATANSRTKFVTSAINFMMAYGFDFVDLDWEYPVSGGLPGNAHRSQDGTNFALLLKEFKRQFALHPSYQFEVTAAISCGLETLVNYRLAEMDPYIDRYNMMCYDFTGPWSAVTDHQSNLFSRTNGSASAALAINWALTNGASRSKVVLGIPIYGRGFTKTAGLLTPFKGNGAGTWEPGVYDYKVLPLPSCTPLWEPITNASFCYNAKTLLLVSYETPTSVSHKMFWILQMGLGGTMTWELSGDYPFSSEQSLQRMIGIWLEGHLDTSPNNLCYPASPHGNINNFCSSARPTLPRRLPEPAIKVEQFRLLKSPKALNVNREILRVARAHYNYSWSP